MSEAEPAGQGPNLQIGQVAERTELSIKTIRHYDDVGLVTPSERSAGGFRLYTEADVQRLLVIRRMKPLGFSLEEMKQLLDSLAVLGDEGSDASIRTGATEFVTACHTRAEESCIHLRKQLAYAEELTGLLAEHSLNGERRS
ncbi:MerR family transcriptional regulator [Rhodococcus erythropolis]|uniref:MerR family transcriptional regulator n=1 Tax=Rhodococcus erythropolis TaxID=1833 RepID=UPI001BE681A1|nr:MerR family transcriptional regulator [Rhodococcus erythropolis]MBT2268182.1 MerR family transcriptional regulator [Rhodococcus erythropolis]